LFHAAQIKSIKCVAGEKISRDGVAPIFMKSERHLTRLRFGFMLRQESIQPGAAPWLVN
jgi:hypothetical protein